MAASPFPLTLPRSHPPEATQTPGQKDRGRIPTGDSLTFLTASAIQAAGKDQFGGSNEQITANFMIMCKQYAQLYQGQLLIGWGVPGSQETTINASNIRMLNLHLRDLSLNAVNDVLDILSNKSSDTLKTISRDEVESLCMLPVESWASQSFMRLSAREKSSREHNREVKKYLSLDIHSLSQYFRVFGIRSGMSNLHSSYSQSACIVGGFAERVENIWGHLVKVGDYLSIVLMYDENGIPEFVPMYSSSRLPDLDKLVTVDATGNRTKAVVYPVGYVLEVLRDVEVTKDETEMKEIQGRAPTDRDFTAPSPDNLSVFITCGGPAIF